MSSERTESRSEVVEIRRVEEHMRATNTDASVLRVVCAHVVKLTTDVALSVRIDEQVKSEHETLAKFLCELEVASAPGIWE